MLVILCAPQPVGARLLLALSRKTSGAGVAVVSTQYVIDGTGTMREYEDI